MKRVRFEALALVACAAIPQLAGAQEPPPAAQETRPDAPSAGDAAGHLSPAQTYRIEVPRLEGAPAIDGSLEGDPVWQKAAHLSDFTQMEPRDGEASTERTEVYVGYDSKNLYVGFRCWASDPSQIMASAMNRDASLEGEDHVEIALDTFQDHQNAFLFTTNPLGVVADGTIRDDGEDVRWDWDAVWSVASSRDARGWTAEFAIPFSALRFQSGRRLTFNLNFARYIASKHELTFWKPLHYTQGLLSSRYKVSKYGEATGFENIQASDLFDAHAYVLLGASGTGAAAPGPLKNGGLDVKIPITSSLVADLTFNPDFAEAEADAQVRKVTRYPVLLPEKREFFKEGASLFYFGDRIADTSKESFEYFNFFQSRQIGLAHDGQVIVPVLGGGRVTGKVGPVGIGLLNLTTPDFHDPGAGIDAPLTNYSALRLKYDLPGGSTIGLLGLNKQGLDGSYNRGFGVDANVIVADFLRLGGYVAKTLSAGLRGDDFAGSADFLLQTKYFSMRGLYSDIGANFNPEMGYLTRSGIRKYQIAPTLSVSPDFLGIRHAYLWSDFSYVTDREGALETRIGSVDLEVVFNNGYAFAVIPQNGVEAITTPFHIYGDIVVPPGRYESNTLFFGFVSDWSAPLSVTVFLDGGQFWGGTHFRARLAAVLQTRAGFVLSGGYDREDATLPWGSFVSQIASATATYSFSPKVSTRGMLQYSSDDSARANLLLIWNYLPGANVYLIFNYQQDLRGSQPWLDNFMAGLKFSYTWGLAPDSLQPPPSRPALGAWGPDEYPVAMQAHAPWEPVR